MLHVTHTLHDIHICAKFLCHQRNNNDIQGQGSRIDLRLKKENLPQAERLESFGLGTNGKGRVTLSTPASDISESSISYYF